MGLCFSFIFMTLSPFQPGYISQISLIYTRTICKPHGVSYYGTYWIFYEW